MRGGIAVIAAALVASLASVACERSATSATADLKAGTTNRASADQKANATNRAPADGAPKPLTLTHGDAKPIVGSDIDATAEGLPPNRTVDLIWETVDGGWVVEDGFRFRGKQYKDATKTIGHAQTDANGRLATRFKVPEDFGGVHSVIVADAGTPLAQGGLEITQTFELDPSEGPIGTPIELRVTGFGWRTMESTWVVNWDNREVGYVSATGTRGTAVARFRATGPLGDHQIRVYTGYMGQSYLNHEQAPNAYLPRPGFSFRVTSGAMKTGGYVEPYQAQTFPASDVTGTGATLTVSPAQGPVNTRVHINGTGFPPNATASLVWGTQAGSRVSGNGFAPEERELSKLTISSDGRLDSSIQIPDDLGGLHALTVRVADQVAAKTFFAIETSIVAMSPASGPAGTPVSIHLKGVGWTDFDNIYIATYDNAYMGYACGFNSQGDVVVNFTAAGTPGIHLIDFYPGIYQGPEKEQQLYRLPMLTYADDHPGNKIPALRFAFEVTSSSPRDTR